MVNRRHPSPPAVAGVQESPWPGERSRARERVRANRRPTHVGTVRIGCVAANILFPPFGGAGAGNSATPASDDAERTYFARPTAGGRSEPDSMGAGPATATGRRRRRCSRSSDRRWDRIRHCGLQWSTSANAGAPGPVAGRIVRPAVDDRRSTTAEPTDSPPVRSLVGRAEPQVRRPL